MDPADIVPESPFFDDHGRPCAIDLPTDYSEPAGGEDQHAPEIQEAIGNLVEMLAAHPPRRAGQYLILMGHMLGRSGCDSDAQLARRMRISASRLSHLRRQFSSMFTGMAGIRSRQRRKQTRKVTG